MASGNVIVRLHVHYETGKEQSMIVTGPSEPLGNADFDAAPRLKAGDGDVWSVALSVPLSTGVLQYKYAAVGRNFRRLEAIQSKRALPLEGLKEGDTLEVYDAWRSATNGVFLSSAFTDAIFHGASDGLLDRNVDAEAMSAKSLAAVNVWRNARSGDHVIVRVAALVTRLLEGHAVYITGAHETVGEWKPEMKVKLTDIGQHQFATMIEVPRAELGFDFKLAIYDERSDKLLLRERGTPRKMPTLAGSGARCLDVDCVLRYEHKWRGAGVALPVFSLRTRNSTGVGEFLDLRQLVDWASATSLKLIQVLPINDTGDNPSPYSATSVFALHPLYINLRAMAEHALDGALPEQLDAELRAARSELDGAPRVQYAAVLQRKVQLMQQIFALAGRAFAQREDFTAWFEQNRDWLPSYAVWRALADKTGEVVFTRWPYGPADVEELSGAGSELYEEVLFTYFVQFHLHCQLKTVSKYAKRRGVALKGDLPIGVSRYSADTWTDRAMFRMEWSAGAPCHGPPPAQNWDFPLYDWEEMRRDGYSWWRRRMKKMEEYFHAFRIDHVLGFFRIWAIPAHNYTGLLGRYEPCPRPITRRELERLRVLDGDGEGSPAAALERLTEPYIRDWLLEKRFGKRVAALLREHALERVGERAYALKPAFATQRDIAQSLSDGGQLREVLLGDDGGEDANKRERALRDALFELVDNRVLIRDDDDLERFYLTCHMAHTSSFQALRDAALRQRLQQLWHDFFWVRQNWRQNGYEKLSALQDAARMMVCTEDLGAVPPEAYEVLDNLGMLGLRIQRWPTQGEWGVPSEYSYLSVCAPSCHDCSTVRQWWREDVGARQHFFRHNFGANAPNECHDWVSQKIVEQHMASSSMLAVVPMQDLLDMWDELRSSNPVDDMINRPGTTEGNWEYRLRESLEELLHRTAFNQFVKDMVVRNHRADTY